MSMGLNVRDKADVCREEKKKEDIPQVEKRREEIKRNRERKTIVCNNQIYESNVLGDAAVKTRWQTLGQFTCICVSVCVCVACMCVVVWEQKIYFRLILTLNHFFFF